MVKSSTRIANLLLDINAVTLSFAKPYLFTFVSGLRGPIYCDNRRLISYPKKRRIVVSEIVKIVKKLKFDIVGGVSTAGIPWAVLVAERLCLPMIYIRPEPKGYGEKRQVEGDMGTGVRVLVLDDLISTGESTIAAIDAVRRNGGKVTDCVSIFTYGLEAAEKNFRETKCKIRSLLSLSDLADVAANRNYISKEEKVALLKWQKDPQKYWK